jgi:Cof subfamily protein (haloacid dehalogenase superfamily)
MIKLIVSDLDGTLLDHSKKVSPRERDALLQIREQGVELCLASGRMHSEIKQVMEEIGITAHSVSQNGAYIHHKDGQSLHAKLFKSDIAVQIFELARPYDLVKVCCSGEANYITHLTAESDKIQSRMFQPFVVHEQIGTALAKELSVCKFSFFGEMKQLKKVEEELNEHLGEHLTMYIAERDCLDIMPLHVSKGNALPALLACMGVKLDEIACIGDNFNDVSMFGLTPHSFAMKTAHPEVLSMAANHVDCVADAIFYVQTYNQTWKSHHGKSS